MKIEKRANNGIFYVVISLVAVLAISFSAIAYSVSNNIVVEGDYINYEATQPVEPTLGATSGTWHTVDEFEYGGALSGSLNFTRGASTTPGGMFAAYNSGEPKICRTVEVEISSNPSHGCSMNISVASSTSATDWGESGTAKAGLIIATTTVPTSTPIVFDVNYNPGTAWNRTTATNMASTTSFLWDKGKYILGAFDVFTLNPKHGANNASSSCYTNIVGKYYLDCHIR